MKRYTRWLALTLALAMCVGLSVTAAFGDVPQPSAGIRRLAEIGVVKGDEQGNLQPQAPLQRQEMAALIYRLISADTEKAAWPMEKANFSDVPAENWSAGFIDACLQRDIVQGVAPGRFAPEQPLTNWQLSALLTRALGYLGLAYPQQTNEMATSLGLWSDAKVALETERTLTREQSMLALDRALRADLVSVGEDADGGLVYTKTGKTYLDAFAKRATGHAAALQSDGTVQVKTGSGAVGLRCADDAAAIGKGAVIDYYYMDENDNGRPDGGECILWLVQVTPTQNPDEEQYDARLPGSGVGLIQQVGMASMDGGVYALYDVSMAGKIYRQVPGSQADENVIDQWLKSSTNPTDVKAYDGQMMLGKINVDADGRIAAFYAVQDTDYNAPDGAYPLPRKEHRVVTEVSDRGDGELYRVSTAITDEVVVLSAEAVVLRVDCGNTNEYQQIKEPLSVGELSAYLEHPMSFYDRNDDGVYDIVVVEETYLP